MHVNNKRMAQGNLEVTNCHHCSFLKIIHIRCGIKQFVCKKDNKIINNHLVHNHELVEVPEWCPFK